MKRLAALALVALLASAACNDRKPPAPTGALSAAQPTEVAVSAAPSASAAPAAASASASVAVVPLGPPRAIDMHVDTPWQIKFKGHSIELKDGQVGMPQLVAGHYGGIVYPIYIADHLHDNNPTIRDADEIYDVVDRIVARHKDVLWPDTAGPTPEGKITAYVAIEGAGAFAEDISQIDRFIKRGVVFVGPVHWHDDKLATAATGKDKDKRGLTKLGKKFCRRVYEAGGVVDVSHLSDKGFEDLVPIAAEYEAPIVATHSNSRAVFEHARNLTDAQLKKIGETGGVAGLNFERNYIHGKESTLDDLVEHALHMIEVAGVDHVGIGSDYDGGTPPAELADAGKIQALAEALEKRGVSEADVHKIFGGNTKRVIEWAKARRNAAKNGESKPARP